MSVTIAIRFPLGRYHATGWDRSVNEGTVEWPPSPWRLLRTLVATWYSRWPELPAPTLDGLLDALADPPTYRTPPVEPGHSRHYLPDPDHRSDQPGGTDLTLDPYLRLSKTADLLVQWDATLSTDQRQVLAKLLELVPYLGRAEAVCEMRLCDDDPLPDESWWRPGSSGAATARLLAPQRPIRRPALEMSTPQMRRERRTTPPESRWVMYARAVPDERPASPPVRPATEVTAIRFAVMGQAPLRATHGVLLADEVHRRVTHALDGGRRELLGHGGATTDHQHAHWLPLSTWPDRGAEVTGLVVWVPGRMTTAEVATIVGTRLQRLSGQRGGPDGYELKGFPPLGLLLQAAGPVESVAPELCGPARRWRSLTPYLPVRHRKREPLPDYLAADVARELSYRDLPAARVAACAPAEGLPDRWAREFRRYRARERLQQARPGLGLRLEFEEPARGPVLLGQLSHFGLGIFVPECD